jgi:amino acid adenylation domain-containing protein
VDRLHPEIGFVSFNQEEIEESIPQRFEKLAAKYPDRIAVKTKLHEISYSALNSLADTIAKAILKQRDVDPNPVALLFEHDAPAIAAIFGALKAGKPFVPLDPAVPFSRIQHIVNDSGASLILTTDDKSVSADYLLDRRSTIINVDRLDDSFDAGALPLPRIMPDATSWILYTSGSTGQPKGVLQTHRNELHNIRHHTHSLGLTAEDRLTLLGSYSTGQGLQDIYCALLNGATLYPWNMKAEGLIRFAEWLEENKLTVYHSAASVFRHFVRNLTGAHTFPDLRVVRLGSEQVTWKDVAAFKRHFPPRCVLVNALSCSEARTIRQYIIDQHTPVGELVPVGYPVEDMEVFLVDDNGEEIAPGQIGEIAVRSRYISPGYWRQPKVTSATFSSDSDQRTYRTGDFGRMSADGCLEHLGRYSGRLKIRGYRVEIYEIELALLRHPEIEQALIKSRENASGDSDLVAYIVLRRQASINASELRKFLKNQIPDYMVPAAFVLLDALPLTPLGKIDHSALPEPGRARPTLNVPFVAPSVPIDQALARLWAEILGIDEIGVQDDFFDLGGNSLLAMQVIARAARMFGAELSLQRFFESPTIADLSGVISMAGGAIRPTSPPIPSAQRNQRLPLSSAQQRLWFLDQWKPNNVAYSICRAHFLAGHLDVKALEESLNSVVARHEILRTSFPPLDEEPAQVIAPVLRLPLNIVGLPQVDARREALRRAEQEATRPFNLAQGPLLRATSIDLGQEGFLFLLVVHQIVCDGWSIQILFHEICKFYEAIVEKRQLSLPDLQIQYADFSVWQRERVQGELLELQLSFWKRRLAGRLPILDLTTDRLRPATQSFHGARHMVGVSKALTEQLKKLSRHRGVTLFVTFMAAFKTLLYRYTGQEDLFVGFPISNRSWPETAELIGFFVNTIVLRSDLSGKPSFSELLIRVRDGCWEAYTHRELPFEKLVEELQPKRDLSRNPLFQVMFIFQNGLPPELKLPGINVETLEIDTGTSKFDLTLSLAEEDCQLTGSFEYSTDLFDRDRIERMAGNFQTLLEAIVKNPDQSIATLPILTEAERHQILVEWNNTAADYPKDKCIQYLFEEQVERTPDAVALEFEEKQITYGDLNERANRLAHYLTTLGVGPEKLVGIFIERSVDMVVGLLGIVKAGGAYVPLDPTYPDERLRFMLRDSNVSVLVTHVTLVEDRGWSMKDGDLRSSIPNSRFQVVYLDRDLSLIEQQSNENPTTRIQQQNLAYVIYTSGSTGQPKGVQIQHSSLINCLSSIGKQINFTPRDVWLSITTISFDIAALELYLPLITGAKLVLANAEESGDATKLIGRIKTSRPNVMQATPSMWQLLFDAEWQCPARFTILSGGETLTRRLANRFLDIADCVWNLYGPTESTIWSTTAKITTDDEAVSIGRPIANTQIYILDDHLQPVPIGIPGEIYIGGNGLARGYLNRPELTAEKFIPNPFSHDLDSRLYRTGDLATYRSDGNIEFLGRSDNQVKIRGNRIELGEIESVLIQHSAVNQTVVIAFDEIGCDSENRQSKSGPVDENPKSLVAYVVCNQETKPTINDLRHFLQSKLPDFMIPSLFVFLDTLPLTPAGKLDRKELPPPDDLRPTLDQRLVTPRTEIEELIAQVWREVLKLEKISVHDNFFDLGGHSLLATRVVSRLRKNFSIDLPLRKIFEMPTVAGLARTVETALRTGQEVERTPILPVSRENPVLPSIAQEPVLSLDDWAPGISVFNIPAAYRLKGTLNVVALEWSITCVVERHEVLRTTFPMVNGQHVQFISPSVSTKLEVIDLGSLADEDREDETRKWAREEAEQPFNLANGPLFRIRLLRLGDEDHLLLITMHHIISDGWSMAVFFRDLAAFYEAFSNGCAPSLPELPIQYADFAHWQRQALRKKLMETQLAYWKKQLDGPLTPLEFPTTRARVSELNFLTARKSVSITGDLFRSLKKASQREESTLFITLLTSLKILLYCYTGHEDVRVGTLLANRNRRGTENLIGHFANTLIIRTSLSGASSLRQVARQVRDKALDCFTHQDLPFEALVRELEQEKRFNRDWLCQVLFTYQTPYPYPVKMPGLSVGFFEEIKNTGDLNLTITTFDLILMLKERADGLVGSLLYKADLFDEAEINWLLGRFHDIVRCMSSEPDQLVSEHCALQGNQR